ncbi:MAG: hypothetical protein LBJ00_02635 [Planctomycetaceae bacterium]|nr:hypothetical protein [Planctomycetaceae bacterium]
MKRWDDTPSFLNKCFLGSISKYGTTYATIERGQNQTSSSSPTLYRKPKSLPCRYRKPEVSQLRATFALSPPRKYWGSTTTSEQLQDLSIPTMRIGSTPLLTRKVSPYDVPCATLPSCIYLASGSSRLLCTLSRYKPPETNIKIKQAAIKIDSKPTHHKGNIEIGQQHLILKFDIYLHIIAKRITVLRTTLPH